MPFIVTSLAQVFRVQGLGFRTEGYHAVRVQYVAASCCTSAEQMATSKQGKVPTKEDQRLDHAMKLEASLPRQFQCPRC
jgi:hypothetical protein